jgi:hypothetical protein
MNQLTLPAPYGHKEGFHISLRAGEGFNPNGTKRVIVKYGCPPNIAQKAVDCLCASDRYDCVVSPSWYKYDGRELRHQLAEEGTELKLIDGPDLADPWLRHNRAHRFAGRTATSAGGAIDAQNLPRVGIDSLRRYLALD